VVEHLIVRRLGRGDEGLVMQAADLFDKLPQPSWVASFLREPTHHILIAYRNTRAVGFITGVLMTHPDKGTEMFVYELAVAPEERRQGIARALLRELTAIAKEKRCYGMWVLTDDDNVAAVGAYRSGGAAPDGEHVMLTWDWSNPSEG